MTVLLAVLIFVAAACCVLQAGSWYTEKTWEFWYPDYAKEDITDMLSREELSDGEYERLYRQTGLTRLAIDDMRGSVEGRGRILTIQEVYFTDYTVNHRRFNPFTYMDEIDGYTSVCYLREGDIILSSSIRVSWWRYGHAAVVVDAENYLIAQTIGPWAKSGVDNITTFSSLADFIVLRPKADDETKSRVVSYMVSDMMDIPYRFTAGLFFNKNPERLKSSQCAHFVWYAYNKFGVDLDSDGGWLVKPQDIANSDELELVQVFGFHPEKLWR